MQVAKSRTLLRAGNLEFSADITALVGSLVLWVIFTLVGLLLLGYSLPKALVMGLAATVLHWVAILLHQFGHAMAARSTGYPITGIRLWGVLSSTRYPDNEPPLPKQVHLRRALGGPVASLIFGALAAILLLFLRNGSWIWWLDLFFAVDNLLILGIGSLLPLGFTDGSTLLALRRRQE